MKEQQYTDDELIEWMIQFYMNEDHWPKLRDMRNPYPGKTTYARRFASEPGRDDGFGNALKIAQERYAERAQAAFEELERNMDEELERNMDNLKKGLVGEITDALTRAMRRFGSACKKIRGWLK
jgi:hypothetical protein